MFAVVPRHQPTSSRASQRTGHSPPPHLSLCLSHSHITATHLPSLCYSGSLLMVLPALKGPVADHIKCIQSGYTGVGGLVTEPET